MRHINIDAQAYVKAAKQAESDNATFPRLEAESFHFPYSEVLPIDSYRPNVEDTETCEPFPNCFKRHKNIFQECKKWLALFPNCCDEHQEASKQWWFNRSDYEIMPEKTINQIAYTEHLILEKYNNEDWHEDITDYLEYNFQSYGSPAIGLHLYLNEIEHFIINTTIDIPYNKREQLVEYVRKFDGIEISGNIPDLNVLHDTYKNWLAIFPFEISIFNDLKPHFQTTFPFLNEVPKVNRYTNLAKAKVHTKESLFESLVELTNKLLTEINGLKLYEKGQLSEPQKLAVELILINRKQKLDSGYKNDSKYEEKRFRKMIKDWLKDEKLFIRELVPFINEKSQAVQENQTVTQQTNTDNNLEQVKATDDYSNDEIALLKNTIKEYLEPLENCFKNNSQYQKVLNALYEYFYSRKTYNGYKVFVKKGNKTSLAKALGDLYRIEKTEAITIEYLQFLKSLFTIYDAENIEKDNITSTNLYKYLTTKH